MIYIKIKKKTWVASGIIKHFFISPDPDLKHNKTKMLPLYEKEFTSGIK